MNFGKILFAYAGYVENRTVNVSVIIERNNMTPEQADSKLSSNPQNEILIKKSRKPKKSIDPPLLHYKTQTEKADDFLIVLFWVAMCGGLIVAGIWGYGKLHEYIYLNGFQAGLDYTRRLVK